MKPPYRAPEKPTKPSPRRGPSDLPEAGPFSRKAMQRGMRESLDREARIAAASIRVRVAGALVLAAGLLLSYLNATDIDAGVPLYPTRMLSFNGMLHGIGLALLVMGIGPTQDPARPAPALIAGVVVAGLAGAVWGATLHFDLLCWLVLG